MGVMGTIFLLVPGSGLGTTLAQSKPRSSSILLFTINVLRSNYPSKIWVAGMQIIILEATKV